MAPRARIVRVPRPPGYFLTAAPARPPPLLPPQSLQRTWPSLSASLVTPTLGDVYLYGTYSNRTAMAGALALLAASGRLRAAHLLDAAYLTSATASHGGAASSLDSAYAATARGRTAYMFRHVALCQARRCGYRAEVPGGRGGSSGPEPLMGPLKLRL